MRPLVAFLLFTVTVSAEPPVSAQLCIERGLILQRHLHDPAQAAALYRRALAAPDATPRTSAEALWHMASNYSRRGADRISLAILGKLQHDCPGIEPFARLAAAESVGLSAESEQGNTQRDGPNAVDLIAAQDTVRLIDAAVKLKDATIAASLFQRLQWHCEAMVFELSIVETTEPPGERRQRENALERSRGWLAWTQSARAAGTIAPDDPMAAKIKDRAVIAGDRMLVGIFAARDAFTVALGNRDAAAATKARSELSTLVTPITHGPEELLLVQGFTGELAGMARIIALLEKNQPAAGLVAWEGTRRVFHESGAGNAGFRVTDMDALPLDLLPEIMGALTFLESAIATLLNDGAGGIDAAQQSLAAAIARVTALAERCSAPAGKKRLEQTVRRLREAAEKLDQGDTNSADTLMRTEFYIAL